MARFSYARLVAKVRRNPAFRRRLMKNPRVVLEEAGLHIPAGTRIKVVQNTTKLIHLVIPGKRRIGVITVLCYGH